MATLPSATTTIDDTAGPGGTGTGYLVLLAAVATAADITPRVFSSTKALLDRHGYSPAADYAAMHFQETRKPIIFLGLPIVTAGVVGQSNATGNTGTSVVTVAVGGDGSLEETDGEVIVTTGGTVGTDQIKLTLSLNGGRTVKALRLGTASSYVIPYVGLTLSFAAGTLVAGDTVLTWHSTAPRWDQAGIEDARIALAAQQRLARSWLVVGDLLVEQDATDVLTEVNLYETGAARFTYARTQIRDRLFLVSMARPHVNMTGGPTLTFLEVGGTGDTITRSAGSWITDGFAVGDVITVAGSVSNNVTGAIASLSATVITLGSTDLADEGPVASCTVVGSPGLTFAEVGGTGDTITRSSGSWLADGFKVGDVVTVAGSGSNNVTGAIATLSATVLTFGSTDLAAEVIGQRSVTITAGETDAVWMALMDAEFEDIADEKRISLAAGRAAKMSPILGYKMRRPAAWAASIREYQHDVQIPTWRVADGALEGWDLEDADGNTVEHDERSDGGALAAGFTCLTSQGNGPPGAFVALDLTRALEASLLSRTHNLAVANVACTTVQAAASAAIGQVLVLNTNGTATEDSIGKIETRVNSALSRALLQDTGEGQRASSAPWIASRADVLNVASPTLTASVDLVLNGTLEHINTSIRVITG